MNTTEEFLFPKIQKSEKRDHLNINLDALYERAFSELGLQQSKRDQIITVYLAMFSFLIPFALSMEGIGWQVKGLIFLAMAIVGVLFGLIIVRYRIYKEVYWLCCQSLTVLQSIQPEKINKEMIQRVYYHTMYKKGKGFIKVNKKGKKRFRKVHYVKKNLFSSESIYFFIHSFITALIFGLSMGLILPGGLPVRILIAAIASVVLVLALGGKYFAECIKVYSVLADDTDESFNKTFSKAWFLHFYA